MYFYHEYYQNYYDACRANAAPDVSGPDDRSADERSLEPIKIPAILKWIVTADIAFCVVFAAFLTLS